MMEDFSFIHSFWLILDRIKIGFLWTTVSLILGTTRTRQIMISRAKASTKFALELRKKWTNLKKIMKFALSHNATSNFMVSDCIIICYHGLLLWVFFSIDNGCI